MHNASTYYNIVSFPQYVLLQALHIAFGIFGTGGNILVLLAYSKFQTVRAMDCSHLMAALAVGDLISGLGSITLGLSRLETALFNDYAYTRLYCIATASVVQVGLEISQLMTASIAIDRCLAMSNPFSYRKMDHRRFALISFAVALLAAGGTILLSVINVDFSIPPNRCSWTSAVSDVNNDIYLLFNAVIGPAIAGIYTLALYKQQKYRRSLVGDYMSEDFFIIQAKLTKMLTTLVSIYLILVALPLFVLFFALTFKNVISVQITYAVISPVAYLGMSLNSSINVLIYVSSSSNLRPYITQLVKCTSS